MDATSEELYGLNLRNHIWELSKTAPTDGNIISLISKLLKVDLLNIEDKDLEELLEKDERTLLEKQEMSIFFGNREVVARWFDVLLTLDKRQLKPHIRKVWANYVHVFEKTGDVGYLVRSLRMVRFAKNLFSQDLENIYTNTKKIAEEITSPFYQQRILKELVAIYGNERCRSYFSEPIEKRIEAYRDQKDFTSLRFCIKSLHLISAINKITQQARLAESYEMEGDLSVAEKKPNTFYPTISQTFLKGLRKLKSIHGYDELRKRLEKKVATAQKEDYRMLRSAGVDMVPNIDIDEIRSRLDEMDLPDFRSTFQLLTDLPIPQKETITRQVELIMARNSFVDRLFSKNVKVNAKGAEVAHKDIKEAHESNIRNFIRERTIAILLVIKSKMDGFWQPDDAFTDMLINNNSTFVPPDRTYIIGLGISEGFRGNFIQAAHLLAPQLENSLRYLAVRNGISMTNLAREIQHENLLGGCLEKLRPLADADIIDELRDFLVEGFSVNFRNELSHGLMDTLAIQKYGMYLWWINLKLILQTTSFFPNINPEEKQI